MKTFQEFINESKFKVGDPVVVITKKSSNHNVHGTVCYVGRDGKTYDVSFGGDDDTSTYREDEIQLVK